MNREMRLLAIGLWSNSGREGRMDKEVGEGRRKA